MMFFRELMRQFLPESIKKWIIVRKEKNTLLLISVFSQSRFLSSFYYCFLSSQFSREHQAVLKGRLSYLKNSGMNKTSNTLLRRNIHRIEKGLVMQPLKSVFALDYIWETLTAYECACRNEQHDQKEISWAYSVLREYFFVVDEHRLEPDISAYFDAINQASRKVISDHQSGSTCDPDEEINNRPYFLSQKIKSTITPQQLSLLCSQRKSVRWFKNQNVDRNELEQAIAIARLAPSACNRQPYQFHIVDKPDVLRALMKILLGVKGFSHNIPCAIVITADLSCYPTERDRHLIYIDGALAGMQLMLALETFGLSSCPINCPDIEERELALASVLNLSDTTRPVMLIALGYGDPDGKVSFSSKKPTEHLIRYVDDLGQKNED
jgi:nitroreductase